MFGCHEFGRKKGDGGMDSLRVGVIGCGMIAQVMHLPHQAELEQYDLCALCDVSPGLLAAMRERYPAAETYADYQQMLERSDVDVVLVLTRFHSEPAIAALRAGKHVFVEKPLCNSLQEADAMIEAAEASNLKLMVGYHKRYDPGYLVGLDEIASAHDVRLIRLHDVIGPNSMFLAHYDLLRYDEIPDEIIRETQAKSDAAIQDAIGDVPDHVRIAYQLMLGLSVHDITILRGAFGQPERVVATEIWPGGRYYTSVFDYGDNLRCLFDTGIVGIRIFDEELAAFADDKVVKISFPSPFLKNAPTIVDVWQMNGDREVERQITASYEEAFRQELIHLHDRIENDKEPQIDMVQSYLGSHT
jgi:predicted dinucleotide-utilizing enzyme